MATSTVMMTHGNRWLYLSCGHTSVLQTCRVSLEGMVGKKRRCHKCERRAAKLRLLALAAARKEQVNG